MADTSHDLSTPFYENDPIEKNTTNDLHAYFMTQFNQELDNKTKNRKNDNFRYGNEESFDFEILDNWTQLDDKAKAYELEVDAVITNENVNEENIKDLLLDLDSIEFDPKQVLKNTKDTQNSVSNYNNDYIDDESLIDELCREESDSRLTPDIFNEEYLSSITSQKHILPSMETAFSKRYYNYNKKSPEPLQTIPKTANPIANEAAIANLDYYSYPNNIMYSMDNDRSYTLPDTPTSCTEFTYDRSDRKVSVCESIESDIQSSCYYDENSETFYEDELFVNLDDFGLSYEGEKAEERSISSLDRRPDKDRSAAFVSAERVCRWEQCAQRYPTQHALVEHIERSHVNTYKGEEFSCLWAGCARARRPFNARYKLLIHMRVHSGHKPNRCHHPGCGKAFSRLENLKIHVRSHTGERPYACPAPHCHKAFSNSSDRAKHQRTHFNARPYACDAAGCGKRYTDPSSLRKHVKSHPHPHAPRACLPAAARAPRVAGGGACGAGGEGGEGGQAPRSPAKLATLRSIRDKLAMQPRAHRPALTTGTARWLVPK